MIVFGLDQNFILSKKYFLNRSHTSYLPAYEDGTERSETLAFELQTPGNNPEESIRLSKHGGS
jgi:hypothetical protein